MKKTIIAISAAVIALAATSCRKENVTDTPSSASVFTATIESGSGTKTTVERVVDAESKAHYKTKWEKDEQINVNGALYKATPKEDSTKADFEYVSGTTPSSPYKAYFPAAMYVGTTSTLPASYTYAEGKYNMPMYAYSETNRLEFRNICAVLAVTVKNEDFPSIKSIKVSSSNRALSGAFTVADGHIARLTDSTTVANTVTLNCLIPVITASGGTVFYIAVPALTYKNLKIELSADGSSYTKAMTTKKDADIKVAVNTVYPITFKNDEPGPQPLSGEFSVSDTTKVRFSPGNLRYIVASGTWDFYEHQYDFCNTNEYSGHHSDTVSLFTWGCGNWSITPDTDTYEESSTMTDWGTKIDDKGTWRTLSMGEWNYLLIRMLTVEGEIKASYGEGNVNGVNGLIILPDSWNGGVCSDFEYGNSEWSNTFSSTTNPTWFAMESAGCVFLPAPGSRDGSKVDGVGDDGGYWSSSAYGADRANSLFFICGFVTQADDSRYYGRPVRLVSVAQ